MSTESNLPHVFMEHLAMEEAGLAAAEQEVERCTKEYNESKERVQRLKNALAALGIDLNDSREIGR